MVRSDLTGLAYFQDRLLMLLHSKKSPEAVKAEMLSDPKLADFYPYIEGMDPDMLEVATELSHTWGVVDKPS